MNIQQFLILVFIGLTECFPMSPSFIVPATTILIGILKVDIQKMNQRKINFTNMFFLQFLDDPIGSNKR